MNQLGEIYNMFLTKDCSIGEAISTVLEREGRKKWLEYFLEALDTGHTQETAKSIADKIGIKNYYSEVLPEGKAEIIKNLKLSKSAY